jgi:multidrug efflux pump
LSKLYGRLLDVTLQSRPAVYVVWVLLGLADHPDVHDVRQGTGTQPKTRASSSVSSMPSANATLDQTSRRRGRGQPRSWSMPETEFTFQITSPASGFGGMVVAPWGDRERHIFEILPEVQQGLGQIPGIQMFAVTPPALPGGGQFPVEFVLAATEEPDKILEFAQALQLKAIQSGMFAFPPIIDVKIDQPEAEIVIDRDKAADLGLNLEQVGRNLASLVGGNYVNRFNISGRSYKVIPQIQRVDRLTAEQLDAVYVTGPDGRLVPLGTIARVENRTVPRSINRFQQFNAVKLSGVAVRPWMKPWRFSRMRPPTFCPRGTSSTTPESPGSCAARATNFYRPSAWPW